MRHLVFWQMSNLLLAEEGLVLPGAGSVLCEAFDVEMLSSPAS